KHGTTYKRLRASRTRGSKPRPGTSFMILPRTTIALRSHPLCALLFALAFLPGLPCQAEQGDDAEFAGQQATAKESFQSKAVPFIKSYCFRCHCSAKTRGEVNFEPALGKPGDAAFSKHWRQALANVQTHDMPPDNVDKQPTDEERKVFVECLAKIKFLA